MTFDFWKKNSNKGEPGLVRVYVESFRRGKIIVQKKKSVAIKIDVGRAGLKKITALVSHTSTTWA